jgi:cysteine-rich repeat protein
MQKSVLLNRVFIIFFTILTFSVFSTNGKTMEATCEPDSGCYQVELVEIIPCTEESGAKFTYKVSVGEDCKDLSHWVLSFDECDFEELILDITASDDADKFSCVDPDLSTQATGLKDDEMIESGMMREITIESSECWCGTPGTFSAKAGDCEPTVGEVIVPASGEDEDGDGFCDDGEEPPLEAVCGNGFRKVDEPGIEECDDGNIMNGDGCSSNCMVEDNCECVDVAAEMEGRVTSECTCAEDSPIGVPEGPGNVSSLEGACSLQQNSSPQLFGSLLFLAWLAVALGTRLIMTKVYIRRKLKE